MPDLYQGLKRELAKRRQQRAASEEMKTNRVVYIKDENGVLHQIQPIHPWRWRALTTWIIIFTAVAIIFGSILQNQVQDVKTTKASIVSLQHTNCRQRNFLVAAYNIRTTSADHETGVKRSADLAAAKSYRVLIGGYGPDALGSCKIIPLHKPKKKGS